MDTKAYKEKYDLIEGIFIGGNIDINELIELLEKHRAETEHYKGVTVYFSAANDGDVSINLECEK